MISILIVSLFGLGVFSYLGRSSANLKSSDISNEVNASAELIQKFLRDDIEQVAYLNPACGSHAPSTGTVPCSDIVIRGGITPLPAVDKSGVELMTNFSIPANISSDPDNLTSTNDGLRLAIFDLRGVSNCPLDSRVSNNPPTGSDSTAEHLFVDCGCTHLHSNGIYLLIESINGKTYSNVLQATQLQNNCSLASPNNHFRVDHQSLSNRYNQIGGLGRSGFTSSARLYPIKLVEWAMGSNGLYRREIQPDASDALGAKPWVLMQANVDQIQFYPVTVTTTSAIEHQRTMQFAADATSDGIEDILGLSPRVFIKSSRKTSGRGQSEDFLRKEIKFYIQMRNI